MVFLYVPGYTTTDPYTSIVEIGENFEVHKLKPRTIYIGVYSFSMTDGIVKRGAEEFDSHDSLCTQNPGWISTISRPPPIRLVVIIFSTTPCNPTSTGC
jgi:hypothetical protein